MIALRAPNRFSGIAMVVMMLAALLVSTVNALNVPGDPTLLEKLGGKFEISQARRVFSTQSLTADNEVFDEEYVLEAYGQFYHLLLNQRKDLFSPDYQEMFVDKDGQVLSRTTLGQIRTDCYYSGIVKDDPSSFVILSSCPIEESSNATAGPILTNSVLTDVSHRVTSLLSRSRAKDGPTTIGAEGVITPPVVTYKDFYGIIRTNDVKFVVEPALPHLSPFGRGSQGDLIVYKDEDYPAEEGHCGNDDGDFEAECEPDSVDEHGHTHAGTCGGFQQQSKEGNARFATQSKSARATEESQAPGQEIRTESGHMFVQANGNTQKYVELLVVNDYQQFLAKGSTTAAWAAANINAVATLYQIPSTSAWGYNVHIRLIGQVTFSGGDPYGTPKMVNSSPFLVSQAADANDLLTKFSSWAGSNRGGLLPNFDNAHLMSGYVWSGSTIGLAWRGGMCGLSPAAYASFGQTRASFDPSPIRMAAITAHEIAHNLGARHDDDSTRYPNPVPSAPPLNKLTREYVDANCASVPGTATDFIMSSRASLTANVWSPCTAAWIQSWMEVGQDGQLKYGGPWNPMCMENVPTTEYNTAPVCGNGLREAGEECDCGVRDCATVDPCCVKETCKLRTGAQCSAYDGCCNPSTCTVFIDSRVCRPAIGVCDLSETCDGENAACPVDIRLSPGNTCSFTDQKGQAGTGMCYNGNCLSHQTQCLAYTQTGTGETAGQCTARPGFQNNDDNGGNNACGGTLSCSSVTNPAGCVGFAVSVFDGTPCGSGRQCLSTLCQNSASLPGYDQTLPTVSCPTNARVSLSSSTAETIRVPEVTANDNVGIAAVTYTANGQRLRGRLFSTGPSTVNIEAVVKDQANNQATCSYILTIDVNPCAAQNPVCNNGGTCVPAGGTDFTCQCTTFYTGPRCTTPTFTNPCEGPTNPCSNGGVCSSDNRGGFTCACNVPWYGPTCTSANPCDDPNQCQNGGTCTYLPGSSPAFSCACPQSFGGQRCNLQNPCTAASGNPCSNAGICRYDGNAGYTCACQGNFAGLNCQEYVGAVPSSGNNLNASPATAKPSWLISCSVFLFALLFGTFVHTS